MTTKFSFTPTIPVGATVLVTGANGLIASHAVDQLVSAGYRVRGTVRDRSKCAWMTDRYGSDRLELVEVPEPSAPGAWDAAVSQGGLVAGVVHVLGAVDPFGHATPDAAIDAEWPWHEALLARAKAEPSVRAFVLTSSAWAAFSPDAGKKQMLTAESWNDGAVARARDASVPAAEKGLAPLEALKTLLERRAWDWVERERPRFVFNAMLPDTVIGKSLHPRGQPVQSTAGLAASIYLDQKSPILDMMQPQWFVDSGDAGRVLMASLITPGVDRERLFAFGGRFSWPRVKAIFQELAPERRMPDLADYGWDQTEVPNARAEELLRGVKQDGWCSLEDSVRDLYECIK